MAFSRSTDGGKTFSAPLPWPGTGGKGAVPAAGSDGALYVCYINDDSIFVGKSTNGGVSFLPEVLVADAARPFSWPDGISEFRFITFPSIAVDSSGGSEDGTVYVTWQDSSTGSDSDIVLSRSTDGGQTWSERVQINDNDESTHPSDQFFPWVAVDRKGRVAVFFNDRRNDRSNWLCDVYAAVSIDGAQTFLPNIRVSQHSFDPHLNGFSGTGDNTDVKRFRFFGDYLGITAAGESFYAAWSDTRDGGGLLWGDSNIYVARILDEVADGDGDGLMGKKQPMKITELAKVIRSKNAGPFELTFDIMFDDADHYETVKRSGVITSKLIARLYSISHNEVLVCRPYDPALAYKITIRRPIASGDLMESDVYGCQQHVPLTSIEIPCED